MMHSFTAFYTDGNLIPNDNEGTLPPDAVSYHGLGSGMTTDSAGKHEEYIEDFVGDEGGTAETG